MSTFVVESIEAVVEKAEQSPTRGDPLRAEPPDAPEIGKKIIEEVGEVVEAPSNPGGAKKRSRSEAIAKSARKLTHMKTPPPAAEPQKTNEITLIAPPDPMQKAQEETLDLEVVVVDPSINCRQGGLNEAYLKQYTEDLERGDRFPPLEVVLIIEEGGRSTYLLAHGFHRLEAHKKAELKTIQALVMKGTRRDALIIAARANGTNGAPRSNKDKEAAVLRLLDDPEWSKLSAPLIAAHVHVSGVYVNNLKKKLGKDNEPTIGRDGKQRRKPKGRQKKEPEFDSAEAMAELKAVRKSWSPSSGTGNLQKFLEAWLKELKKGPAKQPPAAKKKANGVGTATTAGPS